MAVGELRLGVAAGWLSGHPGDRCCVRLGPGVARGGRRRARRVGGHPGGRNRGRRARPSSSATSRTTWTPTWRRARARGCGRSPRSWSSTAPTPTPSWRTSGRSSSRRPWSPAARGPRGTREARARCLAWAVDEVLAARLRGRGGPGVPARPGVRAGVEERPRGGRPLPRRRPRQRRAVDRRLAGALPADGPRRGAPGGAGAHRAAAQRGTAAGGGPRHRAAAGHFGTAAPSPRPGRPPPEGELPAGPGRDAR